MRKDSTLTDVREQTQRWTQDYNESSPHDSLGVMPPKEHREHYEMKNKMLTLDA